MPRPLNFLVNLPNELVSHALQFCSYLDILRFSMTCKTYLEVVRSTVNLQLHIELEANRVWLSDKYADIIPQKLLEALERNRDNWLDLNLDPCQTILTRVYNGRKIHTQWIIQDGLFSDAFYMEGRGSRLTDQIEMIPLDNPESRWNVQLEVPCYDFVTDPLQDLLTLVTFDRENPMCFYLRFCSLLTGLHHPLAMVPVTALQLEFRVDADSHSETNLSVANELLIVELVSSTWNDPWLPPLCNVLIINWRTGALLSHIGTRGGSCAAAYLGLDRLAVFATDITVSSNHTSCIANSARLLIYSEIPTSQSETVSPSDAPCEISSFPVLVPVLCFEFPVFLEHAGLLLRHLSGFKSAWGLSDNRYEFCSDPSCGTLGLFVKFVGGIGEPTELAIFIDVQKMLGRIPKVPPQAPTTIIPWSLWGEYATRWVDLGGRPLSHTSCMDGSRFTISYHEHKSQLVVADFNPLCVRRFKNRESNRYYQVCSEDLGPDIFRKGIWPCLNEGLEERKMMVVNVEENTPTIMTGFSRDPIISRLPYRLTIVRGPTFSYDEWIVDGNNLIGSKIDREAETEHLMVHRVSH